MIEFVDVQKKYQQNQFPSISHLNLKIPDNQFFVLVGASGSGKTTLLKMINGLIKPTSGNVKVAGIELKKTNLTQLRLQMGYVIQNIALFPNLSVSENITIQMEMISSSKTEKKQRVSTLLQEVGLNPEHYANKMPDQLSGGERQRVGIARALAMKPKIILMDEPFSALDPLTREKLQKLIKELQQKNKATIVFVTHDIREALKLGDQIAVLNNGKIEQVGDAKELVEKPANRFIDEFFNQVKSKRTIIDLLKKESIRPGTYNKDARILLADNLIDKLMEYFELSTEPVLIKLENDFFKVTIQNLISFIRKEGTNGKII
ncbi:ABC transporter ATP-binding protein [Fructilactobacillus vespulae]|uniref:ATP-binding cassette domain-containing protein n=1 Tax=Fructilactobacillus vespulae TaxID=1249630 RepID=UPI0039B6B55D